jgi:hypothetical protein
MKPANISPPPPPSERSGADYLTMLEIQSRMKSKGVAALLAILLPFIGCCYASPIAGIGYAIVAGMLIYAGIIVPFFALLALCLYIQSIFWSVGSVSRSNLKLIDQVRSAFGR